MLHIIGLIIKILGIILAVLLGIIVLLLCTVLLVPIRYEVTANFPGELEEAVAKIKFSWFLKLIAGEAGIEKKELYWKVRAAWFRFDGEEENVIEDAEAKIDTSTRKVEETVDGETESKEKLVKQENTKQEKKIVEKRTPEDSKQGKISYFEKMKHKLKAIWEKIKYTFREICDKIKHISEIKDQIADFIMADMHKKAFLKIKKEFKRAIWNLRPRTFRMNLHYGFEDPYRTGQVLAVLSMIYPFVGDNMVVSPNFEHQIMEGNLYIKGKIRAIHFANSLFRLILDKNVRRTFVDGKNFKFN